MKTINGIQGKCMKWWNGLSEGAKANVSYALHSADGPPFFVFLSFSCIYVCCGSMCSLGSMWAQQSYSAVLHLHLWWYFIYIFYIFFLYLFSQHLQIPQWRVSCGSPPNLANKKIKIKKSSKPSQKKIRIKKSTHRLKVTESGCTLRGFNAADAPPHPVM